MSQVWLPWKFLIWDFQGFYNLLRKSWLTSNLGSEIRRNKLFPLILIIFIAMNGELANVSSCLVLRSFEIRTLRRFAPFTASDAAARKECGREVACRSGKPYGLEQRQIGFEWNSRRTRKVVKFISRKSENSQLKLIGQNSKLKVLLDNARNFRLLEIRIIKRIEKLIRA